MRPNPGRCPDDCAIVHPETGEITGYRRVHVRLRNGWTSHASGSWPAADGRPPTRWSISRPAHPFDIAEYEIAD